MFHQITKKIIALVTAVCLLVGVMVVPSAAVGESQMYLYNGVTLPSLPERDDAAYPYAIISGTADSAYNLFLCSKPAVVNVEFGMLVSGGGSVVEYEAAGETWQFVSVGEIAPRTMIAGLFIVWSSYDLLETNSNVYLSASVPIPVIDDSLIYDDIPVDNGPPVVETVPDSESIIEVLNSILEYDIATWNLLAYGTNRIRYIERYVGSILEIISPSEQETALKEATSDVTAAYTETFWSDSGGGFGRSDIEDTGFILQNSKDMFDTGLSVSDFFSLFGTYGWGNWFSAETRDDLDTVPKPAVIDDGEDSELSTYEKNLQEIQSFVGGG